MSFLYVYRTVMLVLTLILTIPALGLIAHWTQGSLVGHTTYSFEPMGLYTASVTLIVIPVMLALPEIRKNAFALYIVSELSIVALLWIFWVVAAALAIQQKDDFYPLENCTGLNIVNVHWCNELFAIVGLTVVIFVLLMKYMLVLLIYAIVMTFRVGGRVWFQSVREIKIKMPAMTHNPGDLESKARRDDSSTSIPMTNYAPPPPSNPVYSAVPQAPQQQQQPYGQPRPTYAAPSSNSPPQVAMQVTSTSAGRSIQQNMYNPSVVQV
ncbi:hypothetical protein BDN70DRAFT_929086 [Pholiota conissans]|uniref:MARVEL domain-containing protein n=1 Tax=Pholiota conissans TaxID=109636 RepID=A0A9P6D5E7_9AGAR|nr:hypothetical protein BDN70DRAFT_929086 [Pholiota conissans]